MTPAIETDVLVVGLGPAGSTAAAAARRAGARVIAIDRKTEAGQPVQCAEFVPKMFGPMLDRHQHSAIGPSRRQMIASMTTFVSREAPHVKDDFPGVMIDRAAFDAALVATAAGYGCDCRFGNTLKDIDGDGRAQLSDGSAIDAKVIIGADGPRSRVGQSIGQVNHAIAETRQITVHLLEPSQSTDIFLSADIPGGYAWLFPKSEHANLGIGIAPSHRQHLKPLLEALHRQLIAEGRVGDEVLRHTGGAIPVGGMLQAAGMRGPALVLLAGDAAGLTNPVTGAGINAALVSGELAGEAAAKAANGRAEAGEDYRQDLADIFEVSLARALARRQQLIDTYTTSAVPTSGDLRRGWIAFPEYWAA